MKRMCSNCSMEMRNSYKVKLSNSPFARLVICGKGKAVKMDAWFCLECGKVDFYASELSRAEKEV